MKKVIVIGSPGAGKSVFSKKLSKITNLSLYHLDMIYHKKDGTQISKTEFDKKLKEILEKDEWIIDGNYQRTLELRLKECDTVFLLDYPVDVCIRGAEDRVGTKRDDLPWVEESLNEEFKKLILEFPNTKLIEIYNIVKEANRRGISVAKPGAKMSDVDFATRSYIESKGYGKYFTHRTGHSIGLQDHEAGDVSASNSEIIKVGQCFSVEPGIYTPEKNIGVRIEDLVLITENGCEVLNKFSKEIIVV